MIGDIFQPTHLLFLLVVILLVLGPKRLPEMARTLGRGFRDFRDAISGEDRSAMNELMQQPIPPSPPAPEPAAAAPDYPQQAMSAPDAELESQPAAAPEPQPAAAPETEPQPAAAPEPQPQPAAGPEPEPVASQASKGPVEGAG